MVFLPNTDEDQPQVDSGLKIAPDQKTSADQVQNSQVSPDLSAPIGGGPSSSQNAFDPSKYLITPEERQAARDEKRRLALIGGIGDNLANRQSFGNFFLGKMNPHQDVSGFTNQLAQNVDQRIQDKKSELQQEMEKPAFQMVSQNLDKDSSVSQAKRSFAQVGLQTMKSMGYLKNNPEVIDGLSAKLQGLNGQEVDNLMKEMPLIKTAAESSIGSGKLEATLAALLFNKEKADRNFGLRSDDQAAKAGDKVTNDSSVKTLTNQLQLSQRAAGILNKPGLTNQEFNDVQQELSNAIAGAKGSALGKLERTEYDSLQQRLEGLKQQITGSPQDAVPPEIRARVQQLNQDMLNSFSQHRAQRAALLKRSYSNNPAAQAEQDRVIQQYSAPEPSAGSSPNAFGMSAKPGQLVKARGRFWRIGADGNSLEEVK